MTNTSFALFYVRVTHTNWQIRSLSVQNNIGLSFCTFRLCILTDERDTRRADTSAGHRSVSFISKGEASLDFAVEHGLFNGTLEVRPVVICLFSVMQCVFKLLTEAWLPQPPLL